MALRSRPTLFLWLARLDQQIRDILSDMDTRDIANLRDWGSRVRQVILNAPLPPELARSITYSNRDQQSNMPHEPTLGQDHIPEGLLVARIAELQMR